MSERRAGRSVFCVDRPSDPCEPKVTGPEVWQIPQDLINSRQKTHGDFRDNGRVMQGMKDLARSGPSWEKLAPHQKEGVDMILHKIGRIVCGDPNWLDHWDDIAGYATRISSFLTSKNLSSKCNIESF